MSRLSVPLQAVLLMLISMLLFSSMNTVIRLLSAEMHSTQMVLLRNIGGLIVVVLWETLRTRALPRFPTQRIKGHFWRASVGIMAMQLWFYSLSIMPLNPATALSFTTPIFSTIIAILFLGEKAGIRRWSAIATGFIGMLVILRPGTGDIGPEAIFVLVSSMIMGVAAVLVKTLTNTEKPETIVFYMALFMTLWSIAPALPHWQEVTPHQMKLVVMIAVLSTAAHLTMARAYQRVEMVMLMPLDFSRLVFTALLAHMFFGETLDTPTILGSLIIVASTVYIAHREHRLKKRASAA